MNSNKKLLLWGFLVLFLLVAATVFLFVGLSSDSEGDGFVVADGEVSVYNAIPSDAVVVLDFKRMDEYALLLEDTLSFADNVLNLESGLVRLQKELVGIDEISAAPFVYSLHYSSKNNVSFLQIADLSNVNKERVQQLLHRSGKGRKYNGVEVFVLPGDLAVALNGNLLLASSSSYVLESAIRHLDNKVSIMDNPDFEKVLKNYGHLSGVYVNHNQIGKLFSGIVEKGYLKYSDFVMDFCSWSRFNIVADGGKLVLQGELDNLGDEARFSNIFNSLHPKKSAMGKILPASTVFAVSLPISDVQEYLKQHQLYLEMHKKSGSFAYKQKLAQGESKVTPRKWIDSLQVEELVSAYCKFGEKCEWITLIRGKQQFGIDNVISAVIEGEKVEAPGQFTFKGYVAAVFGELFSHCNEEAICKVGPWNIIGPQKILEEFANGNAQYFSLDHYLNQTPVSGFLGKEASLKLLANMKEAGDSVLQIFKPYTRECLDSQMLGNNFEYLTMDIRPSATEPVAEISFYATDLEQLPVAKVREDGEIMAFEIDSTVNLTVGPFEVWDVSKKSAAYLEQLPNMRLRYMDANKKGVWAIPFDTPICGYVEQIDLYDNGRLQMLFASGKKMYLLDRVGRFVYGYPAKLPKGVVMGPKLLKDKNGMKYSVVCLNDDNTVSWYDISGKPVEGWSDLVAPEFIKELPELVDLGGTEYWILRAPSQLLVYTMWGKRVEMADSKKKIDRDSDVEFVQNGVLRIKCTDGKMYNWNLETGKIKKWNN